MAVTRPLIQSTRQSGLRRREGQSLVIVCYRLKKVNQNSILSLAFLLIKGGHLRGNTWWRIWALIPLPLTIIVNDAAGAGDKMSMSE